MEYSRSNCIVNNLSLEAGNKLMELRRQVGMAFNEKQGPDLGFDDGEPKIEYLEAYRRYQGNLYSKISKSSWNRLTQTEESKLIVVSALYGLVNWNEPIRYYDRTMDDNIRPRRKLNTWWSHGQLSDILLDFVIENRIKIVHSFLSDKYSHAVYNLSSGLVKNNVEYNFHSYPGLGSGSNYHRGNDVNALIQTLG